MEPAEPDSDALERPQPPRAIRLTSASAQTAALGAASPGGLADRARGFTLLMFFATVFISAVWPAALYAFLVALLGIQGLIALGPQWWVLITAGALFPLPPLWIAAITWSKARDLSREARRLAHLADRLLEPDQSAAYEIATVGMAIRREIEGLSTGVEAALAKVRGLEGAVAAQAMAIEKAASDAEMRAEQVRSRMETERKALGDITASLKTQTEAHARELMAQTRNVEDVTATAQSALDASSRRLDAQGQIFTQAADAAVSGAQKVSRRLDDQTEALNAISDRALVATDALAGRYEEHSARLMEAASNLGEQNVQLEGTLGRQRDLLGNVAELVAHQNTQISETIDEGIGRLEGALEQTVLSARHAADGFRKDIENVATDTDDATGRIALAASRASELAETASARLGEEATRVEALMNRQTGLTKDALMTLFDEFDTLYEARASDLKDLTSDQVEVLRAGLQNARDAAHKALAEQAHEGKALIAEATGTLGSASDKLSGMFERLLAASATSNMKFDETTAKVDAHMRTLPGLAEETAARISAVLDDELNAFARLADESGRKIRTLNEAYARHIPGAPRTGTFSGVRKTGILGDASPLNLSATQSTSHRAQKSEWAWGEVLAAADRPFDDDAPAPAPGPAAPLQSLPEQPTPNQAQAFSQSSLEIFEALQSMAVDLDRALEVDPPRDLLRRYLNGEKGTFTQRLKDISSNETAGQIHDRYLEDGDFRNNVNQYIEHFEGLLNEAIANDQDEIMVETFMSSTTGKVYFLLGGSIGHFG